jgi:hypothetical protein
VEHRGGDISVEKHIVPRGTVHMRECPAQNHRSKPNTRSEVARDCDLSRLAALEYLFEAVSTSSVFHVEHIVSEFCCGMDVPRGTRSNSTGPYWFHAKRLWKGNRAAISDYASIVGPPTFRSFFAPTSKYLRNECGIAIGSRHSHCADFRASSRSRPPIHRMTLPAET